MGGVCLSVDISVSIPTRPVATGVARGGGG